MQQWSFWAISDLREFWCISGCSSSCSSSQIVTLFISNKFGDLSLIRIQKSHVMALFLIFEASLIHIVPMHSTMLSRVVAKFKHVYLTLYVECVMNKQVRGSRRVDFMHKATFPKW